MVSPPAQRILRGALLVFLSFLGCEKVNVVAVDVATVEVTPASLFITPGGSGQLTARVLDDAGDELMGRTVTWSSADGAVATVSTDGRVTAVGTGSTMVTATSGGVSGEATVSVDVTGSIQLSVSEVQFQTLQGGGVSAQNVQVTSGGSGTLSNLDARAEYDGDESPWLAPSLNRSTTPATVTVGTNAGAVASLGPGIYTARVIITAANATNSPFALPVELTINTPSPAIGLSPSSPSPFVIQQGGSAGSGGTKTVSVSNVGGGSLTGLGVGNISYGSGGNNWLNASLNRTSSPATLTLSLRSSVSGLPEDVYTATVPITSNVASNSPQNLSVTLTVGAPPPQIALDSSQVTFVAVEGFNPAPKSVGVTNPGGGTLSNVNASVSPGDPWLTANEASSTAPTDIDLSVNVAGLAPGNYSATVTVTANASNSPQTFDVDLTVVDAPDVDVAPSTVTFVGQELGLPPAAQDVAITNGGGGTLSGLAASVIAYGPGATGWLDPAILGSTTAPTTLRLTPTSVPAQGTYTAMVEVTSTAQGATPDTVDVTFNVGAPASIMLSQTTADFSTTQGSSPPNQTVNVTNDGSGTLTGLTRTIEYGPGANGWLMNTGFNQQTAPATLTLRVNSGTLAPGNYTATVSVISPVADDSPQDIAVTLEVVAAPSIGVSTNSVTFDAVVQGAGNPPNETVTISNDGGGTLSGLGVSDDAPWLSTTLQGGPFPKDLTLSANASGLSVGPHEATVTLTLAAAINSPVTISVSLTVQEPAPSIGVSTNSVTFDAVVQGAGNPPNETVTISNDGGGTLSGLGVSDDAPWLTTALPGGPFPKTLTLSANADGLSVGLHEGTVTLTLAAADNSPVIIDVSLTVNPPPPSIGVSTNSVTFDAVVQGAGDPPNEMVTISNDGGGTLSGLGVSDDAPWLSTTLQGGPFPKDLTLSANADGLSVGLHEGTVTLTLAAADNSPVTIDVSLTVNAPAASIVLDPASVTFDAVTAGGSSPPDEEVAIENGGGGVLDGLDASDDADWLGVSLSTTTAPSLLTLHADITDLVADEYEATVTVTSPVAEDQTLAVSLTVNAAAELTANGLLHGLEPGQGRVPWLDHHGVGSPDRGMRVAGNVSVTAEQTDTNEANNETSASVVVS